MDIKNSLINVQKEITKNLNILYVEDDEKVRTQTSKMLTINFDNIEVAPNGKEALEKLKTDKFDIIFTDLNMPIMDGLSLIKHIRKNDKLVSIVVFSAYDDSTYLLKAVEYGIDGYLVKPFSFRQFQEILQKILDKNSQINSISKAKHSIKLADNFIWDTQKYNLIKNSEKIKLTKNEIALLKLLSSSKNMIFSSQDIEVELFADDYCNNKRVRGLISRFNKKIGTPLVKSIYGQGYELNLE